ncbi:MAG: 30S ribosomal protein S20 [Rickettsiales bacterium]|nr:30S ribosomal protein S20 [Rickettsiales bacterium]RPG14903.1 MAG: 30S ribosomal protein S20 [Pelagibacteraceae bacterium TMED195]|tara:strand:- start:1051 stop:1317 length:267 start_codon:yes stop_codon:yes gene_type:complete
MANIKSAKKRILQSQRRTEINRFRLSRIRTGIKNYESTISAGKKTTIKENFLKLEAEIAKAATKGFLKKNTASRIVSRLSKRLKTSPK